MRTRSSLLVAVVCLTVLTVPALSFEVPWVPADSNPPEGEYAYEDVDSLVIDANRARRDGNTWQAVWNAKLASRLAQNRLDSGTLDETNRPDWEAILGQANSIFDKTIPRLSNAETACLAAWWGVTPELSLHYANSSKDVNRRDDAAAEALAFLAHYPRHKSGGEAAKIARGADNPIRFAGGAHQSIFRLGAVLPLSGAYELYGRSILAGLVLGLEEENRKNLLPMRVVAYDSQGEAWIAAQQAELAFQQGAGVLVGEALSVPTFTLAGIATAKGIPLFSPAATEERVAETGNLVFQTGLSKLEQGRALARYAIGEVGMRKIAIGRTEGEPEGALSAGFRDQAASWDAEVVLVDSPSGTRDFSSSVNQLERADVHGLLLPSDISKAELWGQALRQEGFATRLLASEELDPQNLHSESRGNFEGMILAGLEYAFPAGVFEQVDSLCQTRFAFAADGFVRRGYLTGRIIGMAVRVGVVSPAMLMESISQRLVRPVGTEFPSQNFVRWGDSQATVPIYAVQGGSTVRLK